MPNTDAVINGELRNERCDTERIGMNKEDIIRMAREAGAIFDHMTWVERDLTPVFERFADLVAEQEREACAEICDWISEHYETRTDLNKTQKQVGQLAAEVCGVRIRERG